MSQNNREMEDEGDKRPVFGTVQIGGIADAPLGDEAGREGEAARLRAAAETATEPDTRAVAYTNLGKFHARTGDIDAACEAFRLALHHNPEEADALAHLFFLGRTA